MEVIMKDKNVAYTKEYQDHKRQFDYIFNDEYKSNEVEEKTLLDGKYLLKTHYFSDSSHKVFKYNLNTSKTEVYDINGVQVAEFRNIDHHIDFFEVVEHSNGKNYLFFSTDLYGYSVMDLSDYGTYHYIPEASFIGEETFIWTNVMYCKGNNIIAVDGCYWACPSSIEFYDFSNPEEFPLKRICTSYDMEDELNINSDVTPLRWNDDGTIVLECYEDEGTVKVEKTFDIVTRKIK
jgi:hypothetical protein